MIKHETNCNCSASKPATRTIGAYTYQMVGGWVVVVLWTGWVVGWWFVEYKLVFQFNRVDTIEGSRYVGCAAAAVTGRSSEDYYRTEEDFDCAQRRRRRWTRIEQRLLFC